MTRQKSFKRLVRARMAKTSESYTAARARTGRGWEDWFDLFDSWGGADLSHREIARKVAAELGIDPLAWNVQAVTSSYERARGLRVAIGHSAPHRPLRLGRRWKPGRRHLRCQGRRACRRQPGARPAGRRRDCRRLQEAVAGRPGPAGGPAGGG